MTYVVNFAKGVHLHKYASFEGGERGFGTNGTRGLRRSEIREAWGGENPEGLRRIGDLEEILRGRKSEGT